MMMKQQIAGWPYFQTHPLGPSTKSALQNYPRTLQSTDLAMPLKFHEMAGTGSTFLMLIFFTVISILVQEVHWVDWRQTLQGCGHIALPSSGPRQ